MSWSIYQTMVYVHRTAIRTAKKKPIFSITKLQIYDDAGKKVFICVFALNELQTDNFLNTVP